ncbi:MAG: DNA gyrase inhibitor YacG [Gammaproteobacteria bacterium]|nr:DNA gyrase inhibitor YacG [Gammaproteobacteria bacterium]
MQVKCPTCNTDVEWSTTETRPFCSDRCRLIDLGEWASERRAIPGQTLEDLDVDPDATEFRLRLDRRH